MVAVPHARRHLPSLFTLVATALFAVAVIADCALIQSAGHSHPVVEASIASADPANDSELTGESGDCAPNSGHCVKAALLGAGVKQLPALAQLLLSMVILLALAPVAFAPTVRGPPTSALPIVSGRILLTRFCIARR